MNEFLRRLLMLPPQASSLAREIDQLHMAIISVAVLGWLVVSAATVVFIVRYRAGAHGAAARVARRQAPMIIEVSVIAGLLAGFVGVWALGHAQYVKLQTPPDDSLDVYVVGKQWMWSFAYEDGSASNHDLYVPVGRSVRLLLTSRDVIHSFFVPAFRIKQDAVPGRMSVSWFRALRPGSYPLLCAEYCGLSHSHMRGRVIALTPEHYEDWKREGFDPDHPADVDLAVRTGIAPQGRPDNLASAGQRVASLRGCLRCHTLDGTPHLGPSWAGLYGSSIDLQDGRRIRADDAYLTRSMMEPMEEVRAGYEPIMPSYLGLLDAAEAGALVAFIHSLSGGAPTADAIPLPYAASKPVVVPAQAQGDSTAPFERDAGPSLDVELRLDKEAP